MGDNHLDGDFNPDFIDFFFDKGGTYTGILFTVFVPAGTLPDFYDSSRTVRLSSS